MAGLSLPPGRPVVAAEAGGVEVAWVTESVGDHGELWARLAQDFPRTGLWPLLANGLDDGDLSRPWFDGELTGPAPSGPEPTAREVLERGSADAADDPAEEEPRDHGLRDLATATREVGPVTLTLPTGPAGLLLVPVRRPADVPRALGWWGPANYDLSGADQTAVLRSWEDRFGAVLLGLSFDVMHLAVERPAHRPGAVRPARARALRVLSRQRRPGRRQPGGLRPRRVRGRVVVLVGLTDADQRTARNASSTLANAAGCSECTQWPAPRTLSLRTCGKSAAIAAACSSVM